jgi:hypothetical protein
VALCLAGKSIKSIQICGLNQQPWDFDQHELTFSFMLNMQMKGPNPNQLQKMSVSIYIYTYTHIYILCGKPMKGPRPLRGEPDLCWGLAQLSFRELLQISVGNSLLLKGLQLCVCVAVGGGAAALEHPVPPFQLERPSIWRTAIIRLLCGAGMLFRQYTFQQWKHGASGVKPTTLLYANVDLCRK